MAAENAEKNQKCFTYEADEDDGILEMKCYLPNQQSYLTKIITMDSDNLVLHVKRDILGTIEPADYHMIVVTTNSVKHMEENRPITDYYDDMEKGHISFTRKSNQN
ncbi:hypothetical protein Btru_071803 [Bulinus truncatus]|nr:hypothetical protein Btru_071803 [Bulinus truncatus]